MVKIDSMVVENFNLCVFLEVFLKGWRSLEYKAFLAARVIYY